MRAVEPCIMLETRENIDQLDEIVERWMKRVHNVGYDACFFEINERLDPRAIQSMSTAIRARKGLAQALTRVTIGLERRHDLKRDLQGIRGLFNVNALVVASTSTEVMNFVARDGRIDAISLETQEQAAAFNDGVASLASQSGTIIELPFKPLLSTRGSSRSRLLRTYGKVVDTCLDNHTMLSFPTGATSPVDVKTPAQKIAVLSLLLDLSKQEAKEIIMRNPLELARPGKNRDTGMTVVELDGEDATP